MRAGAADKFISALEVVFLLPLHYSAIYHCFWSMQESNSDNIGAIYYRAAKPTLASVLLSEKARKHIGQKLCVIQAGQVTQRTKSMTTHQFSVRCHAFKERENGKQ